MAGSEMSFVNVPDDTVFYGIKELMESLDGEDIYEDPDFQEPDEILETRSNPEVQVGNPTPFLSGSKDDLATKEVTRERLAPGRKPAPKPSINRDDDPFAQEVPGKSPILQKTHKKKEQKGAIHHTDTGGDTSGKSGIESPKELIVLLNKLCKNDGILPIQVYQDLLIREMNISDGGLTERDLKMFVLGVRAEKMYSSQQVLKDTMQSLSQEISKLVKIQKGLEENRAQMMSAYRTHEEKMVKIVKEEIGRGMSDIGDMISHEERGHVEEPENEVVVPHEIYKESLSKPGPSVDRSSWTPSGLLVPPELVEEFDITELSRPPSADVFLPVAVAELGLGEDVLANDGKCQALLWGPTLKQKIILFNGMASDALKDDIITSIGNYYKLHHG